MLRSNSSGYGSFEGDPLSLESNSLSYSTLGYDQQISSSETPLVKGANSSSTPAPNSQDFSALFSKDLTPNKRAIMEAILTHWTSTPSSYKTSQSALASQNHSTSSTYPSSIRSSVSPSLHSVERHAS